MRFHKFSLMEAPVTPGDWKIKDVVNTWRFNKSQKKWTKTRLSSWCKQKLHCYKMCLFRYQKTTAVWIALNKIHAAHGFVLKDTLFKMDEQVIGGHTMLNKTLFFARKTTWLSLAGAWKGLNWSWG